MHTGECVQSLEMMLVHQPQHGAGSLSGGQDLSESPIFLHTSRVRGDNYAAEIEEMLEEHPYSSARHIASTLGIDHRTVHLTLTDVLHRKHVFLKWVPHELTDAVRRKRELVMHATSWNISKGWVPSKRTDLSQVTRAWWWQMAGSPGRVRPV